MTSIQVGDRYVYKDTGQPVTITEVTERDIWCVFDYGDGKCGVVLGHESAANSLSEYKPPKEYPFGGVPVCGNIRPRNKPAIGWSGPDA